MYEISLALPVQKRTTIEGSRKTTVKKRQLSQKRLPRNTKLRMEMALSLARSGVLEKNTENTLRKYV